MSTRASSRSTNRIFPGASRTQVQFLRATAALGPLVLAEMSSFLPVVNQDASQIIDGQNLGPRLVVPEIKERDTTLVWGAVFRVEGEGVPLPVVRLRVTFIREQDGHLLASVDWQEDGGKLQGDAETDEQFWRHTYRARLEDLQDEQAVHDFFILLNLPRARLALVPALKRWRSRPAVVVAAEPTSPAAPISQEEWRRRAAEHLAGLYNCSVDEALEDVWMPQAHAGPDNQNPEQAVEDWLYSQMPEQG